MVLPEYPTEVLARAVRKHLSGDPDGFSPVPTGKHNRSYFFRIGGAERLIRIAPLAGTPLLFYEAGMMAQEPEVHRIVRSRTSIPVPEILVYDADHDVLPADFLILERLPGIAASEAVFLDEGMWDGVLEQAGRALAQLHAIAGERHGYAGAHRPMEPQATWADAFRILWARLIGQIVEAGFYTAAEGEGLVDILDRRLEHFEHAPPASLLHMDVWAQNILIDNRGRMTGLVDWDRALWGDPEIEFAVLDYCGISRPAFWRGYGKARDRSPSARIREVFYSLYEIQKYIVVYGLRRRQPSHARRYRDEAMRIIKQLF
ncbi:MAG: aminoglycoside phosphotransferase family protein [Planctomycetes bacterium]|nr:aminoglycoside phosphotransferase family protein [Planctomycetota bacterium]